VLCGAADEVLSVLKNDKMREKEKKRDVEGLLGSLAEERFALLVNLGKKITDWVQEDKMQIGKYVTVFCQGRDFTTFPLKNPSVPYKIV